MLAKLALGLAPSSIIFRSRRAQGGPWASASIRPRACLLSAYSARTVAVSLRLAHHVSAVFHRLAVHHQDLSGSSVLAGAVTSSLFSPPM